MNYFYTIRLSVVFLLSCLFALPTYPIIKSLSLVTLNKDGKQVELFIIGDAHIGGGSKDGEECQRDEQDLIAMKQILSSWNNSGKIVCMLESNKYLEEVNKKGLEKSTNYWGLYYQLPYHINGHKKELSNIVFDSCDLRGEVLWWPKKIQMLNSIFGQIGNILIKDPQAYLEKDTLQQNMKLYEKKEGNVSVQEFFDALTKSSLFIKETCQEENLDDISQDFLKSYSLSLDKGIETFKTVFKDTKESAFAGVMNYIIQEAKLNKHDQSDRTVAFSCIDACLDKIKEFNAMYEKITNYIADAGFLITLLKYAKSHDKIVLFCGNNHATALTEYLKKYQEQGKMQNYITKGVLDYRYDNKKSVVCLTPEETRQVLCIPFNKFLDIKDLPKDNFAEIAKPFICVLCKKIAMDKKLLRCSKCKSTYYCSTDCQRGNWKEHKNNCK